MAEVTSTFQLKTGDSAPAFSLPDAEGRQHHLADLTGRKGTLIIFACNHCPFVVQLAETIGHFAKDISESGISTLAINSNDIARYPADAPEKMPAFADESGWQFPYLLDEDQQVAHAYHAACTPDFYLFDHDLKLVYAGQFDAARPNNDKPLTGADLRQAIEALLAGEPPLSPQLPSSGCSIKWKPGNEPSYPA
ncbi:thioredoxin family protein [Verrucomicrobiaceae bacterium 227]